MIHYLFSDIPRLLFEPVAVTAAASCLIAFFVYRKRHDRFYWIIAFACIFMLFWRLAAHSLMVSSRYASILLYPALIFTVWLCFQLKTLDGIPRLKRILPEKIFLWLPVLAVAGLAMASLIKTLHYNPYGKHTVKICQTLVREIQKERKVLVYSQAVPYRIAHYTGIELKNIQLLWVGTDSSIHKTLQQQLEFKKNYFENIYFIFFKKSGEPEPDAQYLKIDSTMGKWECLHREFTSRRKNKEIVLYRFIPAHSNVEIWDRAIPAMSPENKCVNGDFEKFLTGNELKQRLAYYRKIEASDFYTVQKNLFPQIWWLGVGKARNGKSSEMALTADQPIAGKYSLEMNGGGLNSGGMPKQDCVFSGFIRGMKNSLVYVRTCFWNVAEKRTVYMRTVCFHAAPGKTYRFSVPVYEKEVPVNDKRIYIIVHTNGHILLDQVQFIPLKTAASNDR